MRVNTLKQFKDLFRGKQITHNEGDIKLISRGCWEDNRTTTEFSVEYSREYPVVYPICLDKVHVYIVCPHCQRIHIHGSGGGIDYGGFRVPHCHNGDPNYFIKEMD